MEERNILVRIKGRSGSFEAHWNGQSKKCRGSTCAAQIGFAVTKAGGKMPFNISRPVEIDPQGVETFEPHFSDCVDRDEFKKKKKS